MRLILADWLIASPVAARLCCLVVRSDCLQDFRELNDGSCVNVDSVNESFPRAIYRFGCLADAKTCYQNE